MRAAKELASKVFDDPDYLQSVKDRLRAGELPAAVETLLLQYRFGKPMDVVVDVNENSDLDDMSDEELLAEIRRMEEMLVRPAAGERPRG